MVRFTRLSRDAVVQSIARRQQQIDAERVPLERRNRFSSSR
jgi:hypothetical protein